MQRRTFLGALTGAGAALAQQNGFDLVIKGGELRDPGANLRRRADVGIRGGVIAAIEETIPAGRAEVVDAQGRYVTPGMIDLHTHCYWGAAFGVAADPIAARSGVTTWIDAGTFSYDMADGFRKFIVEPAKARIYGYVYLYPSSRNPDIDPVKYVRSVMKRTGETAVKNRDIILGVKFQAGSNMNGRYSLDFLKIARELCDTFKLPLMTHISFAPPETDQVMELMRPGDVVTHCYNTHSIGILTPDGKIKPSVLDARRRGVVFDTGHGAGSFNFAIARKALDAGFVADTISTDIYNINVNGPVYDMPTTISKMLYLGMSFDDIITRVTRAPARIVNRVPRLGALEVGAPADLALLSIEDGTFPLTDSQRNTVQARQRIVCHGAICRGKRLAAAA